MEEKGGGGETTLACVDEEGRRHWRVHIFGSRLFFSLRATNGLTSNLSAEIEKPTSTPLIALVVTIIPLLLLYHVGTFYIVCYTSPTTHPSQLTYTFNELQKKE